MSGTRILPIAGAVAAATLGVWTGLQFHSRAAPPPLLAVPAGQASPPSSRDVDDAQQIADAAPPVKIPQQLPDFSLPDVAGNPTSISKWRGKSLILNFWATWCAPCRREIPVLEALSKEWDGRQVEVVGIAVDFPDKVLAYAKDLKIPYPLLIGEQNALDVAGQLGVESPVFPFTVFTDRRGRVVTLFVGELHKSQADLILGVVEDLNQQHLALAAARQRITEGLRALTPNSAS